MSSQSTLFDNRPLAYESLFLGELPYEPQPDEQDIGLSGLWRAHTIKAGSNGDTLNDYLATIPATVTTILAEHDVHARSGSIDGEAIYSFIDKETIQPIADITAQAVGYWEKALYRNDQNPLLTTTYESSVAFINKLGDERLAHLLASKSLVIETAAAVMQVLPLWSDKPLKPSRADKNELARVIANWGPKFLTEWMDGRILDTWTEPQLITGTMTKTEAQEYHEIFSPSIRKRFAVGNISDPLAALDRVAANLSLMTDEVIADRLGWTPIEAKKIFSPALRKRFAVGNISDPLAALDRVAANLKLLTDEVIAEHLGDDWTVEEVKDIFSPALRKYFALFNISDPLAALDKIAANLSLMTDEVIADRLGWTPIEAKKIFSPALRKRFAVFNSSDPLAALDKIAANLSLMTDEVIADRIGWTPIEAKDIFTPGLRKHLAVKNISDPLAALDKIAANLSLMTDEVIADRLGWTPIEAKKIFSPALRKRFAVFNSSDPLAALDKIAANLSLMTDEVIADRIGWTPIEAKDIINPSLRKHFAVFNSSDPLLGIKDYIEGRITVSGRHFIYSRTIQ